MRVLDPGHRYELNNLKDEGVSFLQFYKDPEIHHGIHASGPSAQEVIRACIDRVQSLDKEKPWAGNELIVWYLRMAIVGFEVRALERAVEKGEAVELLPVNSRGHIFGA